MGTTSRLGRAVGSISDCCLGIGSGAGVDLHGVKLRTLVKTASQSLSSAAPALVFITIMLVRTSTYDGSFDGEALIGRSSLKL
jgi:hypothetical protein